jgi:hypothetical protein
MRDLAAHLSANVKALREAVSGIRAYRHNAQGIEFSMTLLRGALRNIRYHSDQLAKLIGVETDAPTTADNEEDINGA